MEIKEGANTPYVKLDKENCVLTFMGKSYPEHPDTFYEPILAEIEKCKESLTNSKITFNIALEMLNSVSDTVALIMMGLTSEFTIIAKTLVVLFHSQTIV